MACGESADRPGLRLVEVFKTSGVPKYIVVEPVEYARLTAKVVIAKGSGAGGNRIPSKLLFTMHERRKQGHDVQLNVHELRDPVTVPDLALVVSSWHDLASPIQAGIVAMARASK